MTMLAKSAGHSLKEQATLGYDVIGLVWTVDIVEVIKQMDDNIKQQRNIDPQDLQKASEEIQKMKALMQLFGNKCYIANLGHGNTDCQHGDFGKGSEQGFVVKLGENLKLFNFL